MRFLFMRNLVLGLVLGLGASVANAEFSFALIGDQEYDASQEAMFPNLRDDINKDKSVRFVINDGDIKGGSVPCTDELYATRLGEYNLFRAPFIYIVGDNEWTDCHRPKAGGYQPLERLAKVRSVFHNFNSPSLGLRPLTLTRQSPQYPENVRWNYAKVQFVGLNVPGSNNGLSATTNNKYDAENLAEYKIRNAANISWLKEAFAEAKSKNMIGLMMVIQANMWDAIPSTELTGFQEFIKVIADETKAFGKPVILVNGDSHYFRIDKPLPTLPFDPKLAFQPGTWESPEPRLKNFTRVETFGTVNSDWIKVTVDPKDPSVFTFRQRIVSANTSK